MKNFIAFFVSIVAVVATLMIPANGWAAEAPAPASAQAAAQAPSGVESLIGKLPTTLVIRQEATLSDGRHVSVYYKKNGQYCEVYTDADITGYTADDLLKLKSTELSLATAPKGKMVYRVTVSKARAIIKQMVNRYL